jgi:glyoxylase I family protein
MNTLSEHPTAGTGIAQATAATVFHGVRYLVADVQRAIDFYTTHLGFKLEHQQLPMFATVALGPLKIYLSGSGASGSRPLPSGEQQSPGGSNRVVLRVENLPKVIETLRSAGATFRNTMETGPAGKQIQVLDPDSNPVELFEPAHRDEKRAAERKR